MSIIALPSLCSLYIETKFNGQLISSGTGFIVMTRLSPALITNWHIVSGKHTETKKVLSPNAAIPNEIAISHSQIIQNHGKLQVVWVERTEALYLDDQHDQPRWYEHPKYRDKADVVALPLQNYEGVSLFDIPLDVQPTVSLKPADTVSIIGFPFGLKTIGSLPVWMNGFVASEPDFDYAELPRFLVDCRSRPGQSGSPVITYGGNGVVKADIGFEIHDKPVANFYGIYSGRINEKSDIGIVWKRSLIEELVRSI